MCLTKGVCVCVCVWHCSQAIIHPALVCIPGQKKLSDITEKALFLCRPCPSHFYLFLCHYPSLPYSLPNHRQLWPSKHKPHYLIPKSCFLSSLFPFVSLSLFLPTLWAYDLLLLPSGKCVCMTYWVCLCVCVSVNGHLGSWPSSWILPLLLNSDSHPLPLSLFLSLPLLALPA